MTRTVAGIILNLRGMQEENMKHEYDKQLYAERQAKFWKIYPYAPSMDKVDELTRGSIDMHLHCAPDPKVPRRVNGYQAAYWARMAGMRAIVLKSDYYPTAPIATAVRSAVPEVATFGAINLETMLTGGFSEYLPVLIEQHAKMGAKVVWMPTFDANYPFQVRPGEEDKGLRILDENGEKIPEVWKVLEPTMEVIKKYDMVLASGHLGPEESIALFRRAVEMGITKMVATHPFTSFVWPAYPMEAVRELAQLGACIEFTFRDLMPLCGSGNPQVFVDAVREVGAEHCIMSTDLGQSTDAIPADGMHMFIAHMMQYGCSYEEVERMVKKNPARLLGLDAPI